MSHKSKKANNKISISLNYTENDDKLLVVSFKWPFSFISTESDKYTSYHKNKDEFVRKFQKIFTTLIPEISKVKVKDLARCNKHCHKITKKEDLEKIKKIVISSFKKYKGSVDYNYTAWYEQNIEDSELWQIGMNAVDGIRLYGILQREYIFEVLFIDYHHQFCPDVHYNQEDTTSYNYCPIKGEE